MDILSSGMTSRLPELPSINAPLGQAMSAAMNSAAKSTGSSTQPSNSELAEAGKEFESVFLSMMLKTMRSTISEEGMFAGDKSDTFGGMFDMFMSQHLASSDSLGIGKMIESFMSNSVSDDQA